MRACVRLFVQSSAVRSASRRSGTGSVNADIDESLFAGRRTASRGSATSGHLSRNGTAIVSAKLLQQIASNPAAGNTKESVVIDEHELRNIFALTSGRNNNFAATQPLSPQHFSQSQSRTQTFVSPSGAPIRATSASSASKAAARKEKMLRMEKEIAARPAALTESELAERETRTRLLAHARQSIDSSHGDVKHMNQMMLYAQCVTIRDAQILEKRRIADALMEEEKRMDLAMEIERVRTLKLMEEREAARTSEQRQGASVIIQQIAEREQERIRAQEAREQEAAAMMARVRALEEKEEEERQAKVHAGRRLLQEVMDANHAQAKAKLRKKQEEIDEDLRIQAYIRQKEARDAENEAELAHIRAEKEKEIARLRAMQEKAQDRQAAIDELRAKRYQEAKDREWRQQQIEAANKRDAMKRDIAMAREAQRQEKSRRIAEQALQERDEYMRVLEWQADQSANDIARQEAARIRSSQHRQDIQQQMGGKEREKAEARTRYLSEGQIFQQQNQRDRAKLERIKQEKLALMEQMGMPEKYRSELAKKKVLTSNIH
jgi:hypothetical protein